MQTPTEHPANRPLPDSFVTVCIRDVDHPRSAWDVQVSRADPLPGRHAIVMLRAFLVRSGPVPRGLYVSSVDGAAVPCRCSGDEYAPSMGLAPHRATCPQSGGVR